MDRWTNTVLPNLSVLCSEVDTAALLEHITSIPHAVKVRSSGYRQKALSVYALAVVTPFCLSIKEFSLTESESFCEKVRK